MSSNPIRLQILLKRYLDNNISAVELDELWRLMDQHAENDLVEDELLKSWNTTNNETHPHNWDNVFSQVKTRIANNEINYSKVIKRNYSKYILQFAAAASVLIIASAIYFYPSNRREAQQTVTTPKIEVEQPLLNHQVINLPDGSVVTLNHHSKLNYPAAFDGNTREVYLAGEAFFNIKRNPSKPFIVHTGKYQTQVLGTAFNIKAFQQDKQITVTVTRGKVKVERHEDKKLISLLLPGDQLKLSDTATLQDKAAIAPAKVDVAKILEWKNEELVFDNTSFEEASIILNNSFGVKIKLTKPSLRDCKFSGKFMNDNLVSILKIITDLTKTRYKIEKNEVVIDGQGCQ